MDKRAIISDIHGNLEALTAVLEDIRQQQVNRLYCLGDIVGYGPNPRQCIDLVMQMEVCVLGNHDQAALFDPEGFSSGAERAIFWTRRELEAEGETPQNVARWQFLCELPRQHHENGLSFVHGSARNPLMEYVFPEDVHNPGKLQRIFGVMRQYCFQGHTHVPGCFHGRRTVLSPRGCVGRVRAGRAEDDDQCGQCRSAAGWQPAWRLMSYWRIGGSPFGGSPMRGKKRLRKSTQSPNWTIF